MEEIKKYTGVGLIPFWWMGATRPGTHLYLSLINFYIYSNKGQLLFILILKQIKSLIKSLVIIVSAILLFPSFLFADPIQVIGNSLSGQDADSTAQGMSYYGNQGYLITITSEEEGLLHSFNQIIPIDKIIC